MHSAVVKNITTPTTHSTTHTNPFSAEINSPPPEINRKYNSSQMANGVETWEFLPLCRREFPLCKRERKPRVLTSSKAERTQGCSLRLAQSGYGTSGSIAPSPPRFCGCTHAVPQVKKTTTAQACHCFPRISPHEPSFPPLCSPPSRAPLITPRPVRDYAFSVDSGT